MYGEAIINRLHEKCSLRDLDNPVRPIIIDTVGAWLDNHDTTGLLEGVYLQTANGKYLDLFGKDFNLPRNLNETDEHYRKRLFYESLGYLTVDYLINVYDLELYTYVDDFDVNENMLTSNNSFLNTGKFMSFTNDTSIMKSLNQKFIIDNGLYWLNSVGNLDYIIADDVNIINEFSDIYLKSNLSYYFYQNTLIESVKLHISKANTVMGMFRECTTLITVDLDLPNVFNPSYLFRGCSSLNDVDLNLPNATVCTELLRETDVVDIDLSLPNATDCRGLLRGCSNLKTVRLNLPNLNLFNNIFISSSNIEEIDVVIPDTLENSFISMVSGLNLSNLTSFKVNGEDVPL